MKTCFICQRTMNSVFDLGSIYQSTFVSSSDQLPDKSSLCLVQCPNCKLVELKDKIDLDSAYRQYWYKSSLNASMITSLKDVIRGVEEKINLLDNDIVIDIGCNDGSLFDLYSNKNLFKIGFDPALNLEPLAKKKCDLFINHYYEGQVEYKAKVITAIAMFYDLENPRKFLEDIKKNLVDDGIFVIQMTDMLSMFKVNAFDNICHEHLQIYSLNVLNRLLSKHGLSIFDVEYNDVNGGSLRAYISFEGKREINKSVYESLKAEDEYFSLPENSFQNFKLKIDRFKDIVVNFIKSQLEKGKKVFAMGASTKGNTLLQYFGIDSTLIPYVSEVNSDKFGLRTVGTNIEIISETKAIEMKPDVFLVLPWHFRTGLIKKNQKYLESGGSLLFPLPEPELVMKNGVTKL